MNIKKRSILDYFNVNSQQELLEFMKKNPNDQDVLLLKELIHLAKEEGDSFE
ncbi:MAG TPA: hypothetical protein VK105_08620 [Virgibacillus sp.]|nr:hypothetical protein [Virgibacillus sp.]HLR67182.1 hypothetical protein [Virgibacillus sp.]